MSSSLSYELSLDLVIPVYNEEAALPAFHALLCDGLAAVKSETTIYYVNDGSHDATLQALQGLAAGDPRVRIVDLVRNFGHQAALTAGLDLTTSDLVICMDGDGQHPPSLIPEMLRLHAQGFDIVLTQRNNDGSNKAFKRTTSSLFYRLFLKITSTDITPGCADFRLMTREVVNTICRMREYHRFLRGLIAWVGYRSVILPFAAPPRIAGSSKYSFKKMLGMAFDAVFSFSLLPLRIGVVIGAGFFLLSIAEIVYVLSFWLGGKQELLAPGWSSLMFVLLLVGGTITTLLSIIGLYIGCIFQEIKGRPIYIVRSAACGNARKSALAETSAGKEKNNESS